MHTLTIIETADELLGIANPHCCVGDTVPVLQHGKLVFENDMKNVRLDTDEPFDLSDNVTVEQVISALAKAAHLDVHFT
jgi:hypothetical protein